MAGIKTGSAEKRVKRNEKMAASERLTNGYMLCLTYGLGAIVLLEIIRRQYNIITLDSWEFTGMLSIVFGVIFAVAAAAIAILGGIKKISGGRCKTYTVTFVVASLVSFFLSWQIRQPISGKIASLYPEKLAETFPDWGILDFLVNVQLYNDAKFIEYGVIAFLVIAFIVYAIRLARLEKKK